jgi:hypothetical protein
VSEPSGAHTLLIVDNDVGFLWWLGEIFTEAGYRAVPALNCSQALAAVKKFQLQIDLLVVNPALTGVARLATSLERLNRDIKIVVIREGPIGLKYPGFRYDATLTRPSGWEPISRTDWLRKLRTLLRQLETTPTTH